MFRAIRRGPRSLKGNTRSFLVAKGRCIATTATRASAEMVEESLPLPPSGKLRKIIHLSDVHIRAGSPTESRYSEYTAAFAELFREIDKVADDSTAIVVTGDLFNHRCKIETPGITLFSQLLTKAETRGLPLYMICGNHDLRQDSPETPDMLSALMSTVNQESVAYLDRTGFYNAGDVALSTVSISETLLMGQGSGKKPYEELPEFPAGPEGAYRKIALFHGLVKGALYDNDHPIFEGYPLDWFGSKFDALLLGDVHKAQSGEAFPGGPKWAYAGSLIQQTFGEHPTDHGFFLWHLDDLSLHFKRVMAPVGFLRATLKNGEWCSAVDESPIRQLGPNLPRSLRVRVSHSQATDNELEQLVNDLRGFGIDVTLQNANRRPGKGSLLDPSQTMKAATNSTDTSGIEELGDLSNVNTWERYLEERGFPCKAAWLRNPHSLLLSEDGHSRQMQPEITKRNKEIAKAASESENSQPELTNAASAFRVQLVEWSWLFCFGPDCQVDLESADPVSVVSGRNGMGKSSFMDIICLGLFGNPARMSPKDDAHAIVNQRKPGNQDAFVTVTFDLSGQPYSVYRRFRLHGREKRLVVDNVRLKDCRSNEIVARGAKGVSSWLSQRVGSLDEFVAGGLITQTQDKDFFALKLSEQRGIIDKKLNLQPIHACIDSLSTAEKAYSSILSHYETYVLRSLDGLAEGSGEEEDERQFSLQEEADHCQKNVDALERQLGEIRTSDALLPLETIRKEAEKWEPSEGWHGQTEEDLLQLKGAIGSPQIDLKGVVSSPKEFLSLPEPPSEAKWVITDGSSQVQTLEAQGNIDVGRVQQDIARFDELKREKESNQARAEHVESMLNAMGHTIDGDAGRWDELAELERRRDAIKEEMARLRDDMESRDGEENVPDWKTVESLLKASRQQLEESDRALVELFHASERYERESKLRETVPRLNEINAEVVRQARHVESCWDDVEAIAKMKEQLRDCDDALRDVERRIEAIGMLNEYREVRSRIDNLSSEEGEVLGRLQAYAAVYEGKRAHLWRRIDEEVSRARKCAYWHNAEKVKPRAEELERARERLQDVKAELKNAQRLSREERERRRQFRLDKAKYDALKADHDYLARQRAGMESFRDDLYSNRVLPALTRAANEVISAVTGSVELAVEEEEAGEWEWKFKSDSLPLPISKASGFQRFMMNVAMRSALDAAARSASGQARSEQLFIDEGFSAMDDSHLYRLPELFDALIYQGAYSGIIVVSHLERVFNCSDSTINIQERLDGSSYLSFPA